MSGQPKHFHGIADPKPPRTRKRLRKTTQSGSCNKRRKVCEGQEVRAVAGGVRSQGDEEKVLPTVSELKNYKESLDFFLKRLEAYPELYEQQIGNMLDIRDAIIRELNDAFRREWRNGSL